MISWDILIFIYGVNNNTTFLNTGVNIDTMTSVQETDDWITVKIRRKLVDEVRGEIKTDKRFGTPSDFIEYATRKLLGRRHGY